MIWSVHLAGRRPLCLRSRRAEFSAVPAHAFARQMLEFDENVGQYGLAEGRTFRGPTSRAGHRGLRGHEPPDRAVTWPCRIIRA